MQPENTRSKRPSLLAPADTPRAYEPKTAASLSDVSRDRPQRSRVRLITPWVVATIGVLMLFAGIRAWQYGNARAPAAADIAQRSAAAAKVQQNTTRQTGPGQTFASTSAGERSVATIIDYSAPAGRRNSAGPGFAVGRSAASDQTPAAPSNQKLQPGSAMVRSVRGDNAGPPATGKRRTDSTPAAADHRSPATLSVDSSGSTGGSVVRMREIEVIGTPPPEPAPTQPAQSTPADPDIAILAALMSYIDQRDSAPVPGADTGPDIEDWRPQSDRIGVDLAFPLRAKLQQCPPANTVEGIKCRRQVCKGHRGKVPACPAPQNARHLSARP